MIVAWIILTVGLVGTLTFIGISYKKSVKEYHILESDLKEVGQAYYELAKLNLGVNGSIKVDSTQLEEFSLLPNTTIKSDKCDVYIIIKQNTKNYNVFPYIKCDNYVTNGY